MARSPRVVKANTTARSTTGPNIDIQIERWPIERLIPRAIQEFGWTNPILVGAGDDIIAGHARVPAARKLGMSHVPVIVLKHLSEAQRRALVIADNQLSIAGAGWDAELHVRDGHW